MFINSINSHKILKINALSRLDVGSHQIIYSQKSSQPMGYQGVELCWLRYHKVILWIFSSFYNKKVVNHICVWKPLTCLYFGQVTCRREGTHQFEISKDSFKSFLNIYFEN